MRMQSDYCYSLCDLYDGSGEPKQARSVFEAVRTHVRLSGSAIFVAFIRAQITTTIIKITQTVVKPDFVCLYSSYIVRS